MLIILRTLFAVSVVMALSGPAFSANFSSCVGARDDSNFVGTRISFENRCGTAVQITACGFTPSGQVIRKKSSFAPWNGYTQTGFDFPPESRVRYNVCSTNEDCQWPC